MLNCYRVTIDYSYEIDSEKEIQELKKELEEQLNLTQNQTLKRKQIVVKKLKRYNNRTRIAEFDVQEVLSWTEKNKELTIDTKTYIVKLDSSRYDVFRDSLECAACGLKGTKMILEMSQNDKSPHFNLYAQENNKLVLMTKDHIQPKSKGGKNILQNYQTYCCICNNLKANNENLTNEQVKELRILYNDNRSLTRKKFRELIDLHKTILSNNLSITHKELLTEWDYDKNTLSPLKISYGSNKKVWWKCKKGHAWEAMVASRTLLRHDCPYCKNKRINNDNCLATLRPDLTKEWSSDNVFSPKDIGVGYTKKVFWQCAVCQYAWQTTVIHRTTFNTNCPKCAGLIATKENCLSRYYPELCKEWHQKNNESPENFLPYSRKKVWWLGICGHEWEAVISNRVKGSGCPICRESRGEKAIKEYLEKNNIKFQRQYRFEKCRDKYKLPFDFAIFIGNRIGLIEYQGQQHFVPIEIFGGEKVYLETIRRDKIKKIFCSEMKMPLLTISYKHIKQVNSILDQFIKSLGESNVN